MRPELWFRSSRLDQIGKPLASRGARSGETKLRRRLLSILGGPQRLVLAIRGSAEGRRTLAALFPDMDSDIGCEALERSATNNLSMLDELAKIQVNVFPITNLHSFPDEIVQLRQEPDSLIDKSYSRPCYRG